VEYNVFIQFSMHLFIILIQNIYRGCRFEGVRVRISPQIEDAVLAPPNKDAGVPARRLFGPVEMP
jgi:hypothetical protein